MVGELHFSVASLHMYERHWDLKLSKNSDVFPADTPRFDGRAAIGYGFDTLVNEWFEIEGDNPRWRLSTKGELLDFPRADAAQLASGDRLGVDG